MDSGGIVQKALQVPNACCAGCFGSMLFVILLIVALGIEACINILSGVFPKVSGWRKVLKVMSRLSHAFIALLAIFFGVLASVPDAKMYVFRMFGKAVLLKPSPMDPIRCNLFQQVHGRVLEIGPGPGTNFRCWGENTQVTEWVGVEPNSFFAADLAEEKAKYNITFPTKTVWMRGEDLDIAAESFDYVVGAHVLCSVSDTWEVLRQVRRALKPGGQFLFLEHVAAERQTMLFFTQVLLQPFMFIFGAGCQFRELWLDLQESAALPGFDVSLQRRELPEALPFLKPHVLGSATKRH